MSNTERTLSRIVETAEDAVIISRTKQPVLHRAGERGERIGETETLVYSDGTSRKISHWYQWETGRYTRSTVEFL